MNPFLPSDDIRTTQNKLGAYISCSIWTVSLVFCFYYFAMGIQIGGLLFVAAIAFFGFFAARLFFMNRNTLAVILQCFCMYVSLMIVLSFPVVGNYVVMCDLIIALTPIILLNTMQTSVVFINLAVALMVLTIHELLGPTEVEALEKILDFFIKFMVITFVFVQVYGLRLLFEKRSPNGNHTLPGSSGL